MFLDLDGFKPINDTLGHDVGDKLLVALARRLEDGLRGSDTPARFGGDEFIVLCEDVADEQHVISDRRAPPASDRASRSRSTSTS